LEAKTIQNQYKHIIGWVVIIVGIRHFLDLEPHEQFYLPSHVIVIIFRFSPKSDSPHSQIFRKAGQKKAEPNRLVAHESSAADKKRGSIQEPYNDRYSSALTPTKDKYNSSLILKHRWTMEATKCIMKNKEYSLSIERPNYETNRCCD
jgi:hypothetical protein